MSVNAAAAKPQTVVDTVVPAAAAVGKLVDAAVSAAKEAAEAVVKPLVTPDKGDWIPKCSAKVLTMVPLVPLFPILPFPMIGIAIKSVNCPEEKSLNDAWKAANDAVKGAAVGIGEAAGGVAKAQVKSGLERVGEIVSIAGSILGD